MFEYVCVKKDMIVIVEGGAVSSVQMQMRDTWNQSLHDVQLVQDTRTSV